MAAEKEKRIAILQSNYIPWKGYFDLIARVDEFVLYDDRQYTHGDWRNRNRIKTAGGPRWLTIPVERHHGQRIDEARVSDSRWARKHWSTLSQTYARAPRFEDMRNTFAAAYDDCTDEPMLHRINARLMDAVCGVLGIHTRITPVTAYQIGEGRSERLVEICRATGARTYVSGPSARSYLDVSIFESAGVAVEWMDYSGYPEYPQLHPPFVHEVTVLDLLFNTGGEAPEFMKVVHRAA